MPCQISPALSWLIRLITLLGGATGFYCPGGYLARHPRRASDAAQSLSRRPVSAEEDRDVGVHVEVRADENHHSSLKLRARPNRSNSLRSGCGVRSAALLHCPGIRASTISWRSHDLA